ncbi:MAG: hypothetical protein Q9164_005931 [Protoblastenia rupestris]
MDLVAGVRKEGSRGGRGDFKWEDVKDDAQRENYLGHSLMAPVGRWQKNRDLSWYAKGDTSPAALSAAEARKEELRKIKEAEQDALSEALGYGPMPKRNANETPLGQKEVERAIKETAEGDDIDGVKGVGFGAFDGPRNLLARDQSEVLRGVGMEDRSSMKATSRGDGRPKEKVRRNRSNDRYQQNRYDRRRRLMGHTEDTDPKKDITKSIQEATKDRELMDINISVDQIGVALPTIIGAGNILETENTIGGIEETRYFQMDSKFDMTALPALTLTTS